MSINKPPVPGHEITDDRKEAGFDKIEGVARVPRKAIEALNDPIVQAEIELYEQNPTIH